MNRLLNFALGIHGWMSENELLYLESITKDKNLVVEFGSWCGRSSIMLLQAKNLVCIDIWDPNIIPDDILVTLDGKNPEDEFDKNVWEKFSNVTKIKGDLNNKSLCNKIIKKYKGSADVIFIDADHQKESVVNNIVLAKKLLKPNGILCGHDYYNDGHWKDVKIAVDELVDSFIAIDSIWQER